MAYREYVEKGYMPSREMMKKFLIEQIDFKRNFEVVDLYNAVDKISAEDVKAKVVLPKLPVSKMDGIGVCFADFEDGIPDTKNWQEGKEYIFANTGCVVPEPYDTVILIEDVRFIDGKLKILAKPETKGQLIDPLDLLQRDVDVRRRRDGVDAGFGHGAVAALAMDGDVVLFAAGHRDAAARHQHCTYRQRHPGQHMEHHSGVHMGVFQQAARDHIRGALENFFSRLEFQLDRTFQLVLVGLEQLRCTQQHGRMHIVTAAMHLAGDFRAELFTRILGDGQGVHIGTQQDGLAGLFAACQRNDTGLAAILGLIAHLGQGLFHQCLGLGQIKAHLRVTVQGAPPLHQLGFQRLGTAQQFFCSQHFSQLPFCLIFSLHGQPVQWNFPPDCSDSYCGPLQK